MARIVSTLLCLLALCLPKGCLAEVSESFYKDTMQDLILKIKAAGTRQNANFGIILNGAEDIYIFTDTATQARVDNLLDHIDGVLLEGHNYGYAMEDGKVTPKKVQQETNAKLRYVAQRGIPFFNIDYFPDQEVKPRLLNQRTEPYNILNFRGVRALDALPTVVGNSQQVLHLGRVENFCPLLNPQHFSSRNQYLEALRRSEYDLLIVDAYFWEDILTPADVKSLQTKPQGGRRLVYAYMSVGEAADYRYYWLPEYKKQLPVWAEKPNPDWPGAYKVKYWLPEWQRIICDGENSYLKRIVASGFDGAFLDVVDAFNYFAETE